MTKNKARKAATRARVAVTGERYVAARRAIEHGPDTASEGLLHRLTHRAPGVPVHVEGGLVPAQNRRHRPSVKVRAERVQATHGEPRVLIAWQNRIARLVGAK